MDPKKTAAPVPVKPASLEVNNPPVKKEHNKLHVILLTITFFFIPIALAILIGFLVTLGGSLFDSIFYDVILRVDANNWDSPVGYVIFGLALLTTGVFFGRKFPKHSFRSLIYAEIIRIVALCILLGIYIYLFLPRLLEFYQLPDLRYQIVFFLGSYGVIVGSVVLLEYLGITMGRKMDQELRFIHKKLFEHSEAQSHKPLIFLMIFIFVFGLFVGVISMVPAIKGLDRLQKNYVSLIEDLTRMPNYELADNRLITPEFSEYINDNLEITYELPVGWYYSETEYFNITHLARKGNISTFMEISNRPQDNYRLDDYEYQISVRASRISDGKTLADYMAYQSDVMDLTIDYRQAVRTTNRYTIESGKDRQFVKNEIVRTYYILNGPFIFEFTARATDNWDSTFEEFDQMVQSIRFLK